MILFLIVGLWSCKSKKEPIPYVQDLPAHFPQVPFPEKNPMTVEKVELGKKLFFDKNLSSDSTISCASCHLPQFAFSDTTQFSKGVGGALGKRNAPTLTNVAYNTFYFHDGGAETLELQLNVPLTGEVEMNMTYKELANRIAVRQRL